jgi:hypothetical protein
MVVSGMTCARRRHGVARSFDTGIGPHMDPVALAEIKRLEALVCGLLQWLHKAYDAPVVKR